jgi:hypothetical protein
MKLTKVVPQFVEFVPDELRDGVLYISEKYNTAIHKCCCGCGEEVVTPLTPVDWNLRKDGHEISLSPSIGNWNFPCKSHYVIRRNRVEWAASMTKHQIRIVQERDRRDTEVYIAEVNLRKYPSAAKPSAMHQLKEIASIQRSKSQTIWGRLINWWSQRNH